MGGKVGIGTATPSELLDVVGRVHLAQTTAPGTATDKLYNVSGTLYWNGTALGGGGGTPAGSTKQSSSTRAARSGRTRISCGQCQRAAGCGYIESDYFA